MNYLKSRSISICWLTIFPVTWTFASLALRSGSDLLNLLELLLGFAAAFEIVLTIYTKN